MLSRKWAEMAAMSGWDGLSDGFGISNPESECCWGPETSATWHFQDYALRRDLVPGILLQPHVFNGGFPAAPSVSGTGAANAKRAMMIFHEEIGLNKAGR
jgi:hypothetical protein